MPMSGGLDGGMAQVVLLTMIVQIVQLHAAECTDCYRALQGVQIQAVACVGRHGA